MKVIGEIVRREHVTKVNSLEDWEQALLQGCVGVQSGNDERIYFFNGLGEFRGKCTLIDELHNTDFDGFSWEETKPHLFPRRDFWVFVSESIALSSFRDIVQDEQGKIGLCGVDSLQKIKVKEFTFNEELL